MDNIKDAFKKVKQDMDSLRDEINFLKTNLVETREKLVEMAEIMAKIHEEVSSTHKTYVPIETKGSSTHQHLFKALNTLNLPISTGNQGVPTDRQTDRQTHQQTEKQQKIEEKTSINDIGDILNSLDNIKKEIRIKFKRLTDQEFLVFSTIYQLEEEEGKIDHKSLSIKLGLSESSIRDYVGRLIKKGIPVEKKKINNKTITLSISPNLRKIATLSTILQLRGL